MANASINPYLDTTVYFHNSLLFSDTDNTSNGYECLSPSRDLKDKSRGIDKSDKTSFVKTIRQTFNALAQATNPSLCAKQNSVHPVSIASTVKNIISQFRYRRLEDFWFLLSCVRFVNFDLILPYY